MHDFSFSQLFGAGGGGQATQEPPHGPLRLKGRDHGPRGDNAGLPSDSRRSPSHLSLSVTRPRISTDSDVASLEWGLRLYFSNELLGDANNALSGKTSPLFIFSNSCKKNNSSKPD